jgi:predicted RNA-binding Zn ribbon-like protein
MTFSFHRGALSLDFAGTLGSRASEHPEERLPDAAALGTWLAEAGLLEAARPTLAELAQARSLREAIHRIGAGVLANGPPDPRALAVLNRAAEGLKLGAPRLTQNLGVRWTSSAPVATALGRVAADAIERFANDAQRLTRCALPGCGALLLSRSRSDQRRWCSMELCGNRAKAAAHRARQRADRPG